MNNWHLPGNYQFAGVSCGLYNDPERRDLALLVSQKPASAAGVFTQNCVKAAPVRLCEERLPKDTIRAVVICAGNANACTGEQGMKDALRMAEITAEELDCAPIQVLVCSTGVIGRPLPMNKIETGIRKASQLLGDDAQSLDHAAHAIMTTDTRIKVSTRELTIEGKKYVVTGVAKGAAMIGPNMATMLAFVMTDATVRSEDLQGMVRRCTEQTFNRARVEGHTSTNDTLLFLANGQRSTPLTGPPLAQLEATMTSTCVDLARAIVEDAEGATHLITVEVEGTRDDEEATKIARTVADSALVKTAIFGADPNWGRIVSAAGYAGVPFKEEQMSLWLDDVELYRHGVPLPINLDTVSAHIKKNRSITLRLQFTLGGGRATVWTSDLTYDYVRLNAEYTT